MNIRSGFSRRGFVGLSRDGAGVPHARPWAFAATRGARAFAVDRDPLAEYDAYANSLHENPYGATRRS